MFWAYQGSNKVSVSKMCGGTRRVVAHDVIPSAITTSYSKEPMVKTDSMVTLSVRGPTLDVTI